MSTSGSTNFRVNRIQVIDGALRCLGILRAGSSSNGTSMETDAAESLNLMLKSWQNLGIQLWTRSQVTVPIPSGTSSVNFKTPSGGVNIATPLRVVDIYRKDAATDVSMEQISRYDYDRLSNKSTTGSPLQYFYDYQESVGNLHLWPVASSNTNLVVTYHRPFDDMDADADDLDFPQSWMEAVKFNLAVRIASEYGRETPAEVAMLAATTLENAHFSGYEEGSVRFMPSPRMRWR